MTSTRHKSVMNLTVLSTALSPYHPREACLVVSFPVANQQLCRGSSSHRQRCSVDYLKHVFAVSNFPAVFRKTFSLFQAFINLSQNIDINFVSGWLPSFMLGAAPSVVLTSHQKNQGYFHDIRL